jgi:hypothetical protein
MRGDHEAGTGPGKNVTIRISDVKESWMNDRKLKS